jgi:bacteriocin-like protein
MAHIQMTDGNSSDLGLMEELTNEELTNEELTDEELTDEELSAIDGGVLGALATGSILDNVFNGKPIDWRSAGAWAVPEAQLAVWNYRGGLAGASLAGED